MVTKMSHSLEEVMEMQLHFTLLNSGMISSHHR